MSDAFDLGKRINRTTPTPIRGQGKSRPSQAGTTKGRTAPLVRGQIKQSHTQRVFIKHGASAGKAPQSWGKYGRGYLMRDGVGKGNERGMGFNATQEQRDLGKEMSDWQKAGDRQYHHLIISPERSEALDLQQYTRELMAKMEQDFRTKLQWEAVSHHNTKTPHVHVVVRDRDQQGQRLHFPEDYIRNRLTDQAQTLATQRMGYRLEANALRNREQTLGKESYTETDRGLLAKATQRTVDLSRERPETLAQETRLNQEQRRLVQLSQWGLAKETAPGTWELHKDLKKELQFRGANREHAPEWRKPTPEVNRGEQREQENLRVRERIQGIIRTIAQERTMERGRGR